MAAYAALTSLKHIIHNLHNHPSPPISIDKQQVRSLTEVVTFLQVFLQGYNSSSAYSDEADPLEIRIADAAYKAEDVIEHEIVDRIRRQSTIHGNITGVDFYQDLQLVIEEMDLIKNVVMTIHIDNTTAVRPQLRRHVSKDVGGSSSSSSSTSFSTGKINTMVGFDDLFLQVLESLTGSQLNLQIIPISGMGGIGKTTLAQNIFENALVKEHFDIRAWTTISQDYNVREALQELLKQASGYLSNSREDELGLGLYQYLSGRRYVIVMDDMWSLEVWDKIRRYFPNNKDGSRIIVTTRQSNLASHLNNGFTLKFLDGDSSWNLFSKTLYGEESFPLELEEIGKKIVRNCRGLPLSIVTIGGLLAKCEQTREYWKHIERNLNSIVNSEADEYCFRILKMSYNNLPVYLKPCFLYMGVFKEDSEIRVSKLINLWVSEGFLEPTSEKSLETIARENLEDLVDRNLVLVHELGYTGKIKSCKIHDLLRDLCLREAEKERFYGVVWGHIPPSINSMRRVVIQSTLMEKSIKALESMAHVRSLIGYNENRNQIDSVPLYLRLWTTLQLDTYRVEYYQRYAVELVNLRYLSLTYMYLSHRSQFAFPLNLFWNLHIVICRSQEYSFTTPTEIWNMPHLRHVNYHHGVSLPEPSADNDVIMENLHTLKVVRNFKLNQEVVKRIPNIKKLIVRYDDERESNGDYYCLNNLECLQKLESFGFWRCFNNEKVDHIFKKLAFPQSLKKLDLFFNGEYELEEMLGKIGSLPLLHVLKLRGGFFRTGGWETIEGQFRKLKILRLQDCGGLERWTLESSHFPLLKSISLHNLKELTEISSEIGDIATMERIDVWGCNVSAAMCLRKIVEELQEEEEEESFYVQVYLRDEKDLEALQRLAGPNFGVLKY